MKKDKIIFWVTTAIVAVLIGLTPILTWAIRLILLQC
jgi:hypothetical protein